MRKLLCPQCKIAGLYIKNKQGDRLSIYVSDAKEVIPKDSTLSTEGFDITEIYCFGCSWHGSVAQLAKY